MEQHELVPDVISTVPKYTLAVKFGESSNVDFGNPLTIKEVSEVPTLVSWNADPKKLYTLCFTDPDAPSRAEPKVREWVHWLVVNIPGQDINRGEVLIEFVPSSPGENTGLHRYTFLVYEQPGCWKIQCDEQRLNGSAEHRNLRRGFSIRQFALKYRLGEPLAGNFYQTQWDEYVPILRKLLGLDN